MCGIVGFTNFHNTLHISATNCYTADTVLHNMMNTLKRRGPDEFGTYDKPEIFLGHRRLIVIDPDGGVQPIIYNYKGTEYAIVYNGQIYNCTELKEELTSFGFTFSSHSDTEILLKAFIHYGYDVVNHLNGIFAFAVWNNTKKELFLARDHFGIKPLYYTIFKDELIFASEVKALLTYPGITPIVDAQGIGELFGIGPAHTAGTTAFKNIEELKPAHFLIYRDNVCILKQYWKLESTVHIDSLRTTCDKIRFLLEDSIHRQLVSDVPLCTFLSGGLDSSIITLYASNYYKKHNLPPLKTYSVDYVDNDKNFQKTDFQPNSDNYYISIMQKQLHTIHKTIVLDTPELADGLQDAMLARDFPGMADVDSSLLLFCKNVKKEATVSLTGECADEIFGGYPWFFREDALHSNTFPWSLAISERQNLLASSIAEKISLADYIHFRYQQSLDEVVTLPSDSEETIQKRKISHLTLNWFMQTLLDRSDRMAMYNGFELRVPFCDYRLVQYVWNIPWEMKALNGREKGLLRYIMKDLLPSEIVDRKKSPYPKTWNPTYLARVKSMLNTIMKNPDAPITNLLNKDYIMQILETDGKAFTRPWFGQLMTGPQLMAYLCQVNMWLERYQPKIEI